ncbi:MAG: hypothetical protein HZB33_06355 [Nitrospirae bacterium]|nr:hypothetical protein [Nitrospirota bacterium]
MNFSRIDEAYVVTYQRAMVKILVKLQNGEEMEGRLTSFNPRLPVFHLESDGDGGTSRRVAVAMNSVRSVFFLKKESEAGSIVHTEKIDQSVLAGVHGVRLDVEFKDGETCHGTAHKYNPNDTGFYLVPLNPAERFDRIYINAAAVKNVACRRLMGDILLEQNKITQKQLYDALMYQRQQKKRMIGDILTEKNYINHEQLQEGLRRQKIHARFLGEILLEAGYITEDQLVIALRTQHENRNKKLGQILVELKYLAPNDICIALSTQLNLPWADLSNQDVPAEIVRALPEDVIRNLQVFPIELRDDILVVASCKPEEPGLKGEIGKHTDFGIELVVAYDGYILELINRYFTRGPL